MNLYKDKLNVVFYNGYYSVDEMILAYVGAEPPSMNMNQINTDGYSKLDIQDDELCGFMVKLQRYQEEDLPDNYPVQSKNETNEAYEARCMEFEIERIQNLLLDEDIYIIENYTFTDESFSFAIATSMNNLMRVFYNEDMTVGGWSCLVATAYRPDLLEIAYQCGFDESGEEDWNSWYLHNKEALYEQLGAEEKCFYIEIEVLALSNNAIDSNAFVRKF